MVEVKTYGVAMYVDNGGKIDELVDVKDCESEEEAKELLLSDSKEWFDALLCDCPKTDFDRIVSNLDDNGVLDDIILDDKHYLDDFELTEKNCKMRVSIDGVAHYRRFNLMVATYTFFNKQ